MSRHVFLVPGFFGFANLGDFAYWGRVVDKLGVLLDERDMPAELHCVDSLPTASLRERSRALLEAIAAVEPDADAHVHLIGHSTGGLDARLLLTPAVDLESELDAERYASLVRSAISVATPHRGAPIASFFTGLAGRKLLELLSILTHWPLTMWASVAGMFAFPGAVGSLGNTLPAQVYRQLLAEFTPERQAEVRALLGQVERDQSLLTQLTVETIDVFNAAAGDRPGVAYGSVVAQARAPSLTGALRHGLDPVAHAQHGLYVSLRRLAVGYEFPAAEGEYAAALTRAMRGGTTTSSDNDGIVPTLSQPWGACIAAAQADHLDVIGHFHEAGDPAHPYDWLPSGSGFTTADFDAIWARVADFMCAAEIA